LARERLIPVVDAFLWFPAMAIALELRLIDHEYVWSGYSDLFFVAFATSLIQLVLGYRTSLYRGRYRISTFDEIKGIVRVVVLTSIFPILFLVFEFSSAPRTIGFFSTAIVLLGVFFIRFTLRAFVEGNQREVRGTNTLLYGAGETGAGIINQMLRDVERRYHPIGFIDDDRAKQRLEISGYKVLGCLEDLESIVISNKVETVVVTFASVDSTLLNKLQDFSRDNRVKLVVVPSASQIIDGTFKLTDLDEVSDEDLIGRRSIAVNDEAILNLLRGKRILITGAGGSIGSEISRQVHRYKPANVFMLDRDETLLHSLELSLDGKGLLTSKNMILADIRDKERIQEEISKVKPDVVFHAAALKHLSILELYPQEAEKTNVQGTKNVLDAALTSGVSVFVNISTDKAVRPTSQLGITKRKAEYLTYQSGRQAGEDKRFVSVRFGNVLGSRGSVLDTFRTQIKNGGPLTLTDLNVKRYFMTIPEAVHLVLEASTIGRNGDVMLLDMGESIAIKDIAEKLIQKSGKRIEIEVTGLRQGEKLDEDLFEDDRYVQINETHKLKIEKISAE
jgi:FlaA1/EpsC-like NDP-sugar epimerase